MGRNTRLEDKGEIRFTLYGHSLIKGKIVKDEVAKDRFYANQINTKNITKSIVQGIIRSNDVSMTVETQSIINNINEDDYCVNEFTNETFRIDRIEESNITNGTTRPLVKRVLYLAK